MYKIFIRRHYNGFLIAEETELWATDLLRRVMGMLKLRMGSKRGEPKNVTFALAYVLVCIFSAFLQGYYGIAWPRARFMFLLTLSWGLIRLTKKKVQ